MNPYFDLFKKSKNILDSGQVKIEFYKPTDVGAVYVFKVKDTYTVTLVISKQDDTKSSIWKREFTCDCRASIRGGQELCSHSLAALTFLVLN